MTSRELSWWGWGFADKFPSAKERRAIADQVAGLLGVDALEIAEPAPLDAARVPPPRVGVPTEFAGFASGERETRVRHAFGRAYPDLVRGFRGEFAPAPDVVASPATEDDVAAVLAWAARERVAVVPYGGGTTVVAGVEAAVGDGFRGVVSLDMRRMDRVLDVDALSLSARIQAGATGRAIEEQLAPHGLTLRHYPQSFEFATLGGWIVTRSGGHYATLHTRIDDFVQSVRMLTPSGAFESRRFPSSGAGPDPNRLVLGSEGALGVVTEAWMRVQRRPTHRARAALLFEDHDAAVAATRDVAQSRLHPANCRLLDPVEATLHRVAFGASVLLLAFESADHPQDAMLDRAIANAESHGGVVESRSGGDGARDDREGRWRDAFFEGPYLFNVLVSAGVLVDTFETAVTWDRFAALDRAVRDAVSGALERECGGGVVSCRFTHVYPDGPAPYYTFLGRAERGREIEQWRAVKSAASDALAANGATITHHHAVGRTHRPWYAREAPPRFLASLAAVKRELDPEGVMNPGVLMER